VPVGRQSLAGDPVAGVLGALRFHGGDVAARDGLVGCVDSDIASALSASWGVEALLVA
jgi:hypothetical protein